MRNKTAHFNTDQLSAGEALNKAHSLAFAPYAFGAAVILRDKGILALLERGGDAGISLEDLAAATDLSNNSIHVLIEAGLGIGLVYDDSGRYFITKAGHFFLTNDTVRTNANFMRDICLPGIGALQRSLEQGRPAGLSALGPWSNIFDGLSTMSQPARDSWYAFNNHHSDSAFRDALPMLFQHEPRRILDIGGSTGRFALACLDHSDAVHIGVADICADVEKAEPGIEAAVRAGRVTLHHIDVLDVAAALPEGYDTIWMSQFMPCFSESQIADILAKCHAVLPAEGRIYLMETFWDHQRHEAAATALQLTSLYFVNVATGVSRMWSSEELIRMVEAAGFRVRAQKSSIGRGHTLMELRKT